MTGREVVTDPAQLPVHPGDDHGPAEPRSRRRARGVAPSPILAEAVRRRRDAAWFPEPTR